MIVAFSVFFLIFLFMAALANIGCWLVEVHGGNKSKNMNGIFAVCLLLLMCAHTSWLVFGYRNREVVTSEKAIIQTINTAGIIKQIATFSDGEIYDIISSKKLAIDQPAHLVREYTRGYLISFDKSYRIEFIEEPKIEK